MAQKFIKVETGDAVASVKIVDQGTTMLTLTLRTNHASPIFIHGYRETTEASGRKSGHWESWDTSLDEVSHALQLYRQMKSALASTFVKRSEIDPKAGN